MENQSDFNCSHGQREETILKEMGNEASWVEL